MMTQLKRWKQVWFICLMLNVISIFAYGQDGPKISFSEKALVGRKGRELIYVGIAFTMAVFLTYFLVGLGVFKFIQSLRACVFAFAYSKLHNFHDAEDIAHEVFIKAFRKLP